MDVLPSPSLTVHNRAHQGNRDFMAVRQFLIDTYALFQCEMNWEIRRWEGWYYHVLEADLQGDRPWEKAVRLWETADGTLVGVVIPEGPGDIHLQVHPDYRHLEPEMLAWAETQLAVPTADGRRGLTVWALDGDAIRPSLLAARGYQRRHTWNQRRRAVADPVPPTPVPSGYTIRSLGRDSYDDAARWLACANAVFGHSEMVPEMWITFQTHAPAYNPDLHLVAEAADGTFAAIAALTVDYQNRTAVFEPVGTHPDHRRKGLARAVMAEALRRLQRLGSADVVFVATGVDNSANRLYEEMGLMAYSSVSGWEKHLVKG